MLVHVRRSCLLLTAIGSQTGFAASIVVSSEFAMLVYVRRSRLLLTAIGSQTGFAASIVVSSTLLVMATAAAFGILRSGEV